MARGLFRPDEVLPDPSEIFSAFLFFGASNFYDASETFWVKLFALGVVAEGCAEGGELGK